MFGVELGTAVRTGLLLLALVNTTLQLAGFEVLPFTSDQVELFITTIFNIVVTFAAWWKNNSFTKEAKQADKVMKEQKIRAKREKGV